MTDLPTATALPAGRPFNARRAAGHLLIWLLTLHIVAAVLWAGLRLRVWTWELTRPIHFTDDITRGYGWGQAGSGPEGYLNLYEKMARQKADWPLWLDYAPLRLGVMTMWGGHNRRALPHPDVWQPDRAFNWPILWFNTGMEIVGALAAFFLVRRWVRIGDGPRPIASWPREWACRVLRRPPAEPAPAEPPAAISRVAPRADGRPAFVVQPRDDSQRPRLADVGHLDRSNVLAGAAGRRV